MFVQVVSGRTSQPDQIRAAVDAWVRDLAPGADGWLGLTHGVTGDGRYIAAVRFESQLQAQRSAQRPEQVAWWDQTSRLLDGEPDISDSVWVVPDIIGDPGRAGFVQFMQGTGSDPDRARELFESQDSGAFAAFRPDILGSLAIAHESGRWTMALWFTSEADAREGEKKEPTPEIAAEMEKMNEISDGSVPEFFDLSTPWMCAPA